MTQTTEKEKNVYDWTNLKSLCRELVMTVTDRKPKIKDEQINKLLATEAELKQKIIEKPEDIQTFTSLELAEALLATGNYINTIDPESLKDGKKTGNIDLSVEANREFTDFFIKVDKKFNLGHQRLIGLYNDIFVDNQDFYREFSMVGLNTFPNGVAGAIAAYLNINYLYPNGSVEVSSHDQDKKWAVDLVWNNEIGVEQKVFEVKSNKKIKKTVLFDLRVDKDVNELKKLNSSFNPELAAKRNNSMEKIMCYGREKKVEPYWMEVAIG